MLTILVVDDEKLERKGIRFLLNRRSEEMEILEAANGKAACEILQHRAVDIMLTDIKMPFMDGIELVSVAHKLQPNLEMVSFFPDMVSLNMRKRQWLPAFQTMC